MNTRSTNIDICTLRGRYENDPEGYLKAYRAAYRAERAETLRAKSKDRYEADPRVLARRIARVESKKVKEELKRLKRITKAENRLIPKPSVARTKSRSQRRATLARSKAVGVYVPKDKRAKVAPWSNRLVMSEVYRRARMLTRETGVPHVVDHIFPINGLLVCGLHTEANLRVVTRALNVAKANSMPGLCAEELWDPKAPEVYYEGPPLGEAELDNAVQRVYAGELTAREVARQNPGIGRRTIERKVKELRGAIGLLVQSVSSQNS